MKKIISVILVMLMLFTVMAPAASAAEDGRVPIIYIRGNGEALYDKDGNKIAADLEDISLGEGGIDKDVIVETAVNILKPFVLEGMLFDNWDNYGRAVYDELSPLFEGAGLDENGDPINGSGPLPSQITWCDVNLANSAWEFNNGYEYGFIYDWRLSPYDHLDRLHAFITNIMRVTGKKQVAIYARCMGGSLLKAYIDEYGHLGHIRNVLFCDVLSNEATVVSKALSGQIEFDAKTVEKYAGQLDYCGRNNFGVGFVFSDLLNEIVFKTMDFFNQINVTDKALDGVEELYARLYKALIPAVCHAAGMATQVNYWSFVAEEDMDKALDLMFGEEGSELRIKYTGLINKILRYRENISKDLDKFYKELDEKGIHYGFVAKYGFMNAPFTKDADLQSDALVSLTHAAYGATTAPIGKTFSEDYIAVRVAEGNGMYISPDKQVDLSTAVSPKTTWVVKNAHHDVFESYRSVVTAFLNGNNEDIDTIREKTGLTQFMVYDLDTNSVSSMTEENSEDLEFMHISTEKPTTETRLVAFMRFFTMLLNFFTKLLNGTLDFSNLLG